MNDQALWEHALDHLRATADHPQPLLDTWRSETPAGFNDRDLLSEYGWVVFACGLTPQVIQKHWPRLGQAFRSWDPVAVSMARTDVRTAALGVMRNVRKIDAILDCADDLAHNPGRMQALATLPIKLVLAQLQTLPFVGANNRYHLARNLGWDVVVRTGPVSRLAAYLQVTSEELCGRIAVRTGERIRTVDLVLWYWGHQVGDKAIKEMASFFALM